MKKYLISIGVLLLVLVLFNPFVTVPAGERGVVFSLSGGTLNRQLGEGIHFVVPFVQSVVFYDVRTQTYTMSAVQWEGEVKGDDSLTALTSDGQVVRVDLSVRYHPDPQKVANLHQRIGPDYANKVIRPNALSETRVILAEYPVSAVYAAKREVIEQRIAEGLKKSLAASDIVLDEVLLRDLRFSETYAAAIEQKQIAQQNSQRMNYVLSKAEIEKQIQILQARGDARAIELKGKAIAANSKITQYEYARKIAPNVGAIITSGQNVTVPFAPGKTGP